MTTLRCLIFDMDGTLTQTNRLIFDTFNYVAQKYRGRTYSDPEIIAMFGPPEEGALLSIVTPAEIDTVMRDYLEYYRANHARLARLHPGIEGLLALAKERGRIVALFTGKGSATTMITLEEFGIGRYFDCVVTGTDVTDHKPSPEGIRMILNRFALQPDEALMIGDAVSDVKAARSAGVPVASVLWDSYAKDHVLQMNADLVFHEVAEFHDWLRGHLD